ncbi:MAG: PAS domain S-box protein [Methanomassiliicoccales archaeon]|nr:PAS domain S-box protein [Methanomassiliicoccales archaeon]
MEDHSLIRILLVDDELPFLEIAKGFLELEEKFRADIASSVDEALKLLQKNCYDAIISDYQMGDSTGIDLLKTIRSQGNQIPFILFTGKGREEVVIEALNLGADFYINKGTDIRSQFAELSNMIEQAVKRRKYEIALADSEKRYRTIFMNTGTAMAIVEEDTTISLVNDEFSRLVGYAKEEIEGKKSWKDFVPPSEIPRLMKYHVARRIDPRHAPRSYETYAIDKNGTVKTIIVTVEIIPGTKQSLLSAIDISDKRSIENKLRMSEHRLALITDNMLDMVMQVGPDLLIEYASPSHLSSAGHSPGALMGRKLHDLIHPDDLSKLSEVLGRIGIDKYYTCELRFRRADGKPLWVETFWNFLTDENGKFGGAVITSRDISDRKRLESIKSAMLRISQAVTSIGSLQQLYRLVHSIMSELMPVRNFYIALIDNENEEITFPYFVDEYDPPPGSRKLGRGITEYVVRKGEALLASKDDIMRLSREGEIEIFGTLPVDWMGAPLMVGDRKLGAIVVQSYDETIRYTKRELDILNYVSDQIAMAIDHVAAQQGLIEAKEFAENLIKTANVMIVGLDENGNIRIFNDTAERITGYKAVEVIGKNWFETLVPKDRYPEVWEVFSVFKAGDALLRNFENPVLTKSGEERYIFWQNSEIRNSKFGVRIVSFGTDMTEKKKMMEMIERTNRKLNLIGRVSRHDILNQLTAVLGYIELARDRATENDIRSYLEKAANAGRNIERILNSTRDYERLGSVEPRWEKASDLFERGISALDTTGINIKVDLEGVFIEVDPLFEKVFHNLVDNSMRHGRHTKRIEVRYNEAGDGLLIVYEDDGIGIRDDLKKDLFTGKHGKGLYMVKEILSITGMKIEEIGEYGKGARFCIYVPRGRYRLTE